jgi:hypothetical protein
MAFIQLRIRKVMFPGDITFTPNFMKIHPIVQELKTILGVGQKYGHNSMPFFSQKIKKNSRLNTATSKPFPFSSTV